MAIVSADTLQLAHVAETISGQTPANPVFEIWRTTGESLVFSPNTSDSAELGGSSRFAKPANVTGMAVSGDINFELAKFTALEEAIAGVLAAVWGECPLTGAAGGAIDSAARITVGKQLQTFTIEKRFPNPAFVRGTIQTTTAGATGAQTADVTVAGGPAVGTGMAIIVVTGTGTGVSNRLEVPISVGMTDDQLAAAIAAVLPANAGVTATSTAGVVTFDAGAGETIDVLTARAGQDEFFYQRYKGAGYSAFSLSVAPNETVTGSVSVVGGAPELDVLPIPGATYQSAGANPVFTAPQVLDLSVGALGLNTNCWTSLEIALDSQNRGIPCIGTQGDREVVLGTLTATVSGDVYFSDQSILEALLNNDTLGDSVITLSDADGNIYRFDFYGMKPTAGEVAAGGAGQDLTIPVTLQPTPVTVCEDAQNNPWDSGLILSTVNTAPSLP